MVWPAIIAAGAALAGGALSARNARKQAAQQEATQREFAQMGVRWKVADAKAAGLHPLAALGASTATYSPVTYVDSMGPALNQAGQDISRAVAQTQDQRGRDRMGEFMAQQVAAQDARDARAYNQSMREIDLERARIQLQTDQVRYAAAASQAARVQQQLGPSLPSPGSTVELPGGGGRYSSVSGSVNPSGVVKVDPSKVTSAEPGEPGREAGSTPGFKKYNVPGGWIVLPGQAMSEGAEGLGEIWKNLIMGPATIGANVSEYFREPARPEALKDPRIKWNRYLRRWEFQP